MESREMTLAEWVAQLPPCHSARKEYERIISAQAGVVEALPDEDTVARRLCFMRHANILAREQRVRLPKQEQMDIVWESRCLSEKSRWIHKAEAALTAIKEPSHD